MSAAAEAPGPGSEALESTLLLAERRTNRPDILTGFRRYRGGWDIANKHYWAVSSSLFLSFWLCSNVIASVKVRS